MTKIKFLYLLFLKVFLVILILTCNWYLHMPGVCWILCTLPNSLQIFTSIFPRHYNPPDGFQFEINDMSEPIQVLLWLSRLVIILSLFSSVILCLASAIINSAGIMLYVIFLWLKDVPFLFDYNVQERVNDFVAAAISQVSQLKGLCWISFINTSFSWFPPFPRNSFLFPNSCSWLMHLGAACKIQSFMHPSDKLIVGYVTWWTIYFSFTCVGEMASSLP